MSQTQVPALFPISSLDGETHFSVSLLMPLTVLQGRVIGVSRRFTLLTRVRLRAHGSKPCQLLSIRLRGCLTPGNDYIDNFMEMRARAFSQPLLEFKGDLAVLCIEAPEVLVDVEWELVALELVENKVLQLTRGAMGVVENNVLVGKCQIFCVRAGSGLPSGRP
ncbi:hypothetical protein [Pseudomonas putida]|uniref:hypothetical protein n=1 Tax=Pseudomonas putida TaxID=303 RepID=UPI0018A8C839|nr:hypothetical protein [Pseudomonas putida]MBF8659479.1 hypothetical protein [Pseudomonas putida]